LNARLLILLLIVLLTACQNKENREYIHWSEAGENVTERLRDGGVDYKVENGEIYIPRDQLKRATYCCT
jgi:flagellar biosynthesis/type III secretory pathway M-ring protein FliF/YscJ